MERVVQAYVCVCLLIAVAAGAFGISEYKWALQKRGDYALLESQSATRVAAYGGDSEDVADARSRFVPVQFAYAEMAEAVLRLLLAFGSIAIGSILSLALLVWRGAQEKNRPKKEPRACDGRSGIPNNPK